MSHHWKVLREAGLVSVADRGTNHWNGAVLEALRGVAARDAVPPSVHQAAGRGRTGAQASSRGDLTVS